MIIKKKDALILLLLISNWGVFFGQENDYRFQSFTTANGLSQSSVIAIEQDNLEQIWIGTRDGLNKYDGNSFTVYRNNPTDSTTISNNDILAIEEDSEGMLWVGTYNGLNMYNPQTDKFHQFFHTPENSSLPNNIIWEIKEIKDEIWIGTFNGLSIYNKSTGKFTSYLPQDSSHNSLPGKFVLSIVERKDGEVWIGTDNGLCKVIINDENKIQFLRIDYEKENKVKHRLSVKDIKEDAQHNLWIATRYTGLYKINKNTTKLISFQEKKEFKHFDKDIRAINFDSNHNLWLGTYSGVSLLKPDGSIQSITNPKEYSGLSKVKTIVTDANGSVWIGTYYGGLHLWDDTNTNFINYDQQVQKNALSYNVVGSIAASNDSLIFFGTEGGGITQLDLKANKTSYINSNNTKNFLSDNIKSLTLVGDLLWVGAFNSGIFLYHIKTKKVVKPNFPKKLKVLLKNKSVYISRLENDSIIWLGTFGSGVIRYNMHNKTFNQLKSDSNLTNNRTRSLLVDSKQRVWIGTQSGLNLVTKGNGAQEGWQVQHFFYDDKTISGVDILTIYEDSQHNIWVGTKARGLFLFNGNSFSPVLIQKDGTTINTVHSILEDTEDNLWLSSNKGIVKYQVKNKDIVIYDQTDGLISNEYNDNSCLNFNNTQFYFGGPSGVSAFNPERILVNYYSPQVILKDFRIKNEPVNIGAEKSVLQKSISYSKSITLDYDEANFTIGFAIPNFINANNNQYKYRLIGLENTWFTTTSNQVNYIIQKPGTYIFEVKGANNDGIWNSVPTTLSIVVKPAPWRSWWAFGLYAIFIGVSLVYLISFLKSKTKLQHKLELESIEKKRNEEIHKAKLQFFTNISHEFRTPLTLILGPLQQILSDYKGSNKMYRKLLVIENSANHLLQLINRLMDFRKLETSQLKLQAAEGNIVKFLKEIYLSFSEYAKMGNYTYTFEADNNEIDVFYDRAKLERVFYNLISNAFRYTPKGGEVSIKVSHDSTSIFVDIEDSGVGIADEYKDKIFDRFFEVPIHNQPQKKYNKGSGIGLSIAKNIVALHKGNLHLIDKTTSGAIFRVSLPLGKAHLEDTEIISDFKLSDDISQYEIQLNDKDSYLLTNTKEALIPLDNKQTILIAEDNEPLRLFIKNLLNKSYNIIEAENGKMALQKAVENLPDLIISDVIMPEMVGTELCSKLKENIKTSHIPVILLTSRSALIYKFEGLESGADEYISKPFNVKEFQLRVKNILDNQLRLKAKFSSSTELTPSEITISSLDEELLKKAFSIVEANIANDEFDIAYFSQELGVSRTMLFNKIKAWTNSTPNEFIHEIRMKRAAQLLETNKVNISQISYKVGFKNPKYFSKCFQKKFGETPSSYQQRFSNSFLV